MNSHSKRLFVALIVSIIAHAGSIGYYIYSPNSSSSISNSPKQGNSFSLSLSQISNLNQNAILQATSDPISPKPSKANNKKTKQTKKVEKIQDISENKITQEEITQNDISSSDTSIAKADNEANVAGGSSSSGNASSDLNEGSNWQGQVLAAIQKNLSFPQDSISRRQKGKVKVKFKLINKDDFEFLQVVRGCGHHALDTHALKTIDKAKKDFPSQAIGRLITVDVIFDLRKI